MLSVLRRLLGAHYLQQFVEGYRTKTKTPLLTTHTHTDNRKKNPNFSSLKSLIENLKSLKTFKISQNLQKYHSCWRLELRLATTRWCCRRSMKAGKQLYYLYSTPECPPNQHLLRVVLHLLLR
ncbi:hypothetical protein ES332_A12G050700v1 [Gossypium tomentosum]|uniref:Uncharacterized protein n=1 Tax=Gossypium tomentosum TaxID=34277 RepID=A0A5D2MSN8_GOSTO|nr:hypothetical protein ES332_A12G050700v1 [Gossypium tomentosum]TYH94581.1 hypothetical protein ES332_A12G050700v1 [Gossypium tomentosum]